MTSILFVCHGNICRSPMAEFVMKDMARKCGIEHEMYVESAATSTEELGNDIHYGTRAKLTEQGIPFSRRRARQISPDDYDRFDCIIVMDGSNLRNLRSIIPSDPDGKIHKLLDFTPRQGDDIADPWYTGDFDLTYNDIAEGCAGLLDFLCKSKISY